MTSIRLGCATFLVAVGQAAFGQPQGDSADEGFIAAEPIVQAGRETRPSSAETPPKRRLTPIPVQPQQPKIVRPRIVAPLKKVAVPVRQAPERKARRIKYMPAAEVAEAINELLRQEPGQRDGAAIVADPVTNTLLISAAPAVMPQIESLVDAMDRKPASIQVVAAIVQVAREGGDEGAQRPATHTVWKEGIASALKELQARGQVRVLASPAINAVNDQAAFVQIGQRESRITGARVSSQGRSNMVELENVGLILGVTARANDDRWITMEVDLEDSRLGAEGEGAVIAATPDGEEIRSQDVDVTVLQTTVSILSGHAVLIGGASVRRDDRHTEFWMVLEGRIID
jgi:type II secretory pathway component GspD/PulD (secretin)